MIPRNKAELFLENLQKSVYSRIGSPQGPTKVSGDYTQELIEEILKKESPFMQPEEINERRTAMIEKIDELYKSELHTRFEDPLRYRLMLLLMVQIEEAAEKLSIQIPERPLIGTLPTGRVNAMAVTVPDSNEYIVIFESEIFIFANRLSKIVVKALPFIGNKNGRWTFSWKKDIKFDRIIDENNEIFKRFQEVVLAYVLLGRPKVWPKYLLGGPYRSLASILLESMELFVMGHEYGHIIKGHLSAGQLTAAAFGEEEINEIVFSWQQELEADVVGLTLMLQSMKKRGLDLALSFWGADFFFSCIDIVERGVSIIRTGKENDQSRSSHPPAQIRREILRAHLRKWYSRDVSKGPINLGITLERIIETLWERTRSALRRYHENGKKLAPFW